MIDPFEMNIHSLVQDRFALVASHIRGIYIGFDRQNLQRQLLRFFRVIVCFRSIYSDFSEQLLAFKFLTPRAPSDTLLVLQQGFSGETLLSNKGHAQDTRVQRVYGLILS